MIYTVTLNPAIDYVVFMDSLREGMISRAKEERAYLGGKGINVSLVLKELGVSSVATGFTAGFTGKAIEEGLVDEGIQVEFVRLQKGLTRINLKLRAGSETDINGNGPEILSEDTERLFAKLKGLQRGDILVLAGSIPGSLPPDIYERIMQRLQPKGVRFVVDAEGELLLKALAYHPFLIKPNHEELGQLFGVRVQNKAQAVDYAVKLREQGAQNVLVSMGSQGAVLLDEFGEIYEAEAIEGTAVDTVGAGDSMLAGFLAGFLETQSYQEALWLGNAAGGATAFREGLAKRDEIMALL